MKEIINDNQDRQLRIWPLVIQIVQFIVLILCIIILTFILSKEGPYQNEMINVISEVHPNQKVVQWKDEDLDGSKIVRYSLRQSDGLLYCVNVQYKEDQVDEENQIDILDGYIDTYIKQGDGCKVVEDLVQSLNNDEYTLLYDGSDLVGIEVYDQDLFDDICKSIYDQFSGMMQSTDKVDTEIDGESQMNIQYGINCNFVVQYIDNTKQGFGSADIKQLIDLKREYDSIK